MTKATPPRGLSGVDDYCAAWRDGRANGQAGDVLVFNGSGVCGACADGSSDCFALTAARADADGPRRDFILIMAH